MLQKDLEAKVQSDKYYYNYYIVTILLFIITIILYYYYYYLLLPLLPLRNAPEPTLEA